LLDPVTLDQLRTFVAVADEGSFSAAARKLRRVQSAVSHAMASLEGQLGVALWDRSTKIATLTDRGRVLLGAARRVCAGADTLRCIAEGMVRGLEASVSLCVDAIFPVAALVKLGREFLREHPTVQLRVLTETMAAVSARVLDGTCDLGVVGPTGHVPELERQHIASVRMIPVVSGDHPLAGLRGRAPTERLAEEIQIVLSERGEGRAPDQAVLSRQTWRIADLHTKIELLRGGAGWGNVPEHVVRADLKRGSLVRLRPEAWGDDEHVLPLAVVHRRGFAMGPAARWVVQRMTELCSRELEPAVEEAGDARREARGGRAPEARRAKKRRRSA
jgi:DNA-binding transcriptional LysR family regulator